MRSPLWALCRWRQHGLMVASRELQGLWGAALLSEAKEHVVQVGLNTQKNYSIFDGIYVLVELF